MVTGLTTLADWFDARDAVGAPTSGDEVPRDLRVWADKLAKLRPIAERLRTQDGRATADPMFAVQEERKEYGYDSDYAEDSVWVAYDDAGEYSEVAAGTLGARQVYYKEVWHTVTVAFTEAACAAYIRQNKHNLGETRIYAHSLYRNYEMIDIRAWLMSLAEDLARVGADSTDAAETAEETRA